MKDLVLAKEIFEQRDSHGFKLLLQSLEESEQSLMEGFMRCKTLEEFQQQQAEVRATRSLKKVVKGEHYTPAPTENKSTIDGAYTT